MKPTLVLALVVFGLSFFFLTEKLSAAQVLAVSSNGKWATAYEPMANDFGPLVVKAEAECAAKGGKDIRIVWSQSSNNFWSTPRMAHGAIAISDNGTGTIVGWCFNVPYQNHKRAIKDCLKKGGRNPKIVASF
jgi:hypothetical protein